VTEHTIYRYWCPHWRENVEPVVPDVLPGSMFGLRVVVLSAWLHYLLGTTLAQIVDVFSVDLQFPLSPGGLVQMWRRLEGVLLAWHLEIWNLTVFGFQFTNSLFPLFPSVPR